VTLPDGFSFAVAAEDPYGNVATSFNQGLTASLTNPVGSGFSGGGAVVRAVDGVAGFANFFVGTPGTGYTIRVTSGDGALSVLTAPFSVTRGASAPPPGSTGSPTIIGERVLIAGKGRHKHLIGFELDFRSALDPSRASDAANYTITQAVRRGRKRLAQPVRFTARYDPTANAVSLLVAGRPSFAKGGQIVINAAPPSGITDTSGDYLAGSTIFIILPKARGMRG
jgi:hypothetical protein